MLTTPMLQSSCDPSDLRQVCAGGRRGGCGGWGDPVCVCVCVCVCALTYRLVLFVKQYHKR